MSRKIAGRKKTVSKQLTVIFVGLMAGIILSCLFANALLSERFYMYMKERAIFDAYDKIVDASEADDFSQEQFILTLNDIALRDSISMCVLDSQSETRYVSTNGGEHLEMRLLGFIFGMVGANETVMESTKDYTLQMSKDKTLEFLELYGRTDNGISFILQTPLESIQESASIGMRLYALIGLIGLIIGAIVMARVTKSITKPLRELDDLSQRMVELDFEAKYRGHSQNEIGTLGENMNRMSASLENTISELKTANNELQKDIEKKTRIDEMRKEFLANVSHELKTPIALIQGYAEGLQDDITEDTQTRQYYCEVIIDEANKMNHMVKQLMSLNQMESGNDIVNMERFDLAELIRDCYEQDKLLAEEKNIKVLVGDLRPCFVWGDEFKTEEVFTNYFSNAVNHCSGENYIEIKLERGDTHTRVFVFNSGDPIPAEAIDHIWEKFYKVDKARTRKYGGSGVGLSIVKAIMESMNQRFGVENYKNGVGFWFELENCNHLNDGSRVGD